MSGNFQLMRREHIEPTIQGLGFGGQPHVLIRTVERFLVWVPGYTAYINRMTGSVYAETSMWSVLRDGDLANETGRRKPAPRICEGGRLKDRLRDPEIVKRIEREFGEGIVGLINPQATLVVGGDPFPNSYYPDPEKPRERYRRKYVSSIWGNNHPLEEFKEGRTER